MKLTISCLLTLQMLYTKFGEDKPSSSWEENVNAWSTEWSGDLKTLQDWRKSNSNQPHTHSSNWKTFIYEYWTWLYKVQNARVSGKRDYMGVAIFIRIWNPILCIKEITLRRKVFVQTTLNWTNKKCTRSLCLSRCSVKMGVSFRNNKRPVESS